MKRILLFGGSFDPVHNAHILLAETAFRMIGADACYFILAKNPRWKTPTSTAKDRLNMLKLALRGHRHMKISRIEYRSKEEVTYTYDTLVRIRKRRRAEYFYLIGSDQLELLDKWHRIDELCQIVQFVVFRRHGYPLKEENMKRYHCRLLESEEFDISSTRIRFLNRLDCPKPVLDYIAEHQLYYTTILKNYITPKRLKHSFSVADLAYDIAACNGKDALRAYHAGLIHDIAKSVSGEEAEALMQQHFPEYASRVGAWGYHQFLATVVAREIFKIEDPEILEAIEFHATGKKHMTPLAKIVYCADKIDPSRGWNSKAYIRACKKDYKVGFRMVLMDNLRYFREHHIDYSNELTMECFSYYLGELEES